MVSNNDLSLQEQAIKNVRIAYAQLPHGDSKFTECVNDTHRTITEVLKVVAVQEKLFRKKRYMRTLQRFNKHAKCLENLSSVIEVVVQTNASIGCPIWAPLKFVMLVSNNQIEVAEQVSLLLETVSEYLPRFEIYQQLQQHADLQIALLNIFTDIIDFSVHAFAYYGKSSLTLLTRSIVRPAKYEFENIMAKLKRHANEADKTAVAIELLKAGESRKVAEKIQIRKWLKAVNTNSILEECVNTKINNTCKWVQNHADFLRWKSSASLPTKHRILCVQGPRGCGKTILAASVASELRNQKELVLYFPFSSVNDERSTVDSLIRSFFSQIFQEVDEETHKLVHNLMLRDESSVSDLWKAFDNICSRTNRLIYCVVDGVDEGKGSASLLFDHLKQSLTFNPCMHLMVSAQPQALLEFQGESKQNIRIEPEMVQDDIDAFISTELLKYEIFHLPRLMDSVSKVLKAEAHGMFLWARLIIDDLRKSATQAEIQKRLTALPQSLEQAYRRTFFRMIKSLDKHQLSFAKNILSLLAVSLRSLSVEEIQHAHATAVNDGATSLEACLLFQPHKKILEVLGGLVNITKSSVQLVHSSLLDFLLRPEQDWANEEDLEILTFRINREEAHRLMAAIIIDYAVGRNFDYGYSMSAEVEWRIRIESQHPFLKYASQFAFKHLLDSGPVTAQLLKKIRLLGDAPARCRVSWFEYAGVLCFQDNSFDLLLIQIELVSSWLSKSQDYSIEFGYDDPATYIVEEAEKELKRRINEFGAQDSRTLAWQMLFDYVVPERSLIVEAVPESDNAIAETAVSDLPRLTKNLLLSVSLAQPPKLYQVVLFIRRLKSYKSLTDPLQLLFQILVSKAAVVPAQVLLEFGRFYCRLKKYDQSLEVYQAALERVETRETPIKYMILSELGDIYFIQDKPDLALELYTRIIQGQERFWAATHPIVVANVIMMARILICLKRYQEAEIRLQEILLLAQTGYYIPPTRLSNTLGAAKDLAKSLLTQNNLKFAEVFYAQVFTDQGGKLVNHEIITKAQYSLGLCFFNQEKYSEAKALFREVLAAEESTLGINHQDTLTTVDDLADCLYFEEKFEEAEPLYHRIFEEQKTLLGKVHYDTLEAARKLAHTLFGQMKFLDAEVLYRCIFNTRETTLGTEHLSTFTAASDLATTLFHLGRFEDAEHLYRNTLAARTLIVEADDEYVITSQHKFALCLYDQGMYLEAENLFRCVFAAREKAVGENHKETITAQTYISRCLILQFLVNRDRDKLLEAMIFNRQVFHTRSATLGTEDPNTMTAATELARSLSWGDRYETAIALYGRVFNFQKDLSGASDPSTLEAGRHLAYAIRMEKESIELYEAVKIMYN